MKCNFFILIVSFFTMLSACSHNSIYQNAQQGNPIIYEIHLKNFDTTNSLKLSKFHVSHTEHIDLNAIYGNNLISYINKKSSILYSTNIFIVSANNLQSNERVLIFANTINENAIRVLYGLLYESLSGGQRGAIVGSAAGAGGLSNSDGIDINNIKADNISSNMVVIVDHEISILINKLKTNCMFIIDNINIPFNEDIPLDKMLYIKIYAIDCCLKKLDHVSETNILYTNIEFSKKNLIKIRQFIVDNYKNIQITNQNHTIPISIVIN